MKLDDLKKKIQEYQYFEDTSIIDVALASIISTRMKLGDPVWLVVIGASSGGKSQILRPLALTDVKYMHRIDDLTENTFLSGMKTKEGNNSLLNRIGSSGMLVMSDLTVLFSKQKESRGAILAQFRMIYDGEMIKHSGSKGEAIGWKGALGVLAGSTPSIYGHFEEVSDMGERFIYYRMKDYDARKATHVALERRKFGKELDTELASGYDEYIKEVVMRGGDDRALPKEIMDRIIEVAMFAERVRTNAHIDQWSRDKRIDKIPVPAFPMRVALQLVSVAKGLNEMRKYEGEVIGEKDMRIVDWLGWSLANEEKRACLIVLAKVEFGLMMSTQSVADKIGLDTSVIGNVLQNLSAIGMLTRSGGGGSLLWCIKNKEDYDCVQRVNDIILEARSGEIEKDRELTREESSEELERVAEQSWLELTNE